MQVQLFLMNESEFPRNDKGASASVSYEWKWISKKWQRLMILVCIKETLGNFIPTFQPTHSKGNKGLPYKGHSSFYILANKK